MPTMDSLEKLFEHDLKDIYDAEKRLTKALPKMAKAATSPDLRSAMEEHLRVTQNQVGRLEQIFDSLGKKPVGKTCLGMKGLIEEGEEALSAEATEPYTDLALICAARRVEHYEMAAYMSLRSLAERMDDQDVMDLIDANLREEEEADETLASISTQLLDEETASAVDEDEEEDEDAEEVEEEEVAEKPAVKAKQPGRKS